MPSLISKPLVACTTNEEFFSDRVEAAASEIGSDFWSSEDFDLTLQQCDNRLSCVVFDYETAGCSIHPNRLKRRPVSQSLIVVIPSGDVRAAFLSASIGAVSVIEKSNFTSELIVNLKTALASETRMEDYRSGEKRFSDPVFADLTAREKEILSLLMDGEPNKRVAAILDVGLRTVEAERAQVIKKLNAGSFVELVKLVSRLEHDVLETRKNIFSSIFARESGFPN